MSEPRGNVAAAVIVGMWAATATGFAIFALLSSRQALRELDELRAQLGLQAPQPQPVSAPVAQAPGPASQTSNGRARGELKPEIVIDTATQ